MGAAVSELVPGIFETREKPRGRKVFLATLGSRIKLKFQAGTVVGANSDTQTEKTTWGRGKKREEKKERPFFPR